MCTHEQYIHSIRDIAAAHCPAAAVRLNAIKLTYGAGNPQLRGVTYYERWAQGDDSAVLTPHVEVCAFGQSSFIQLAGTTIHELGHVIAGYGVGHGKEWKLACEMLGLRKAMAAGQVYQRAQLVAPIRHAIAALPLPSDGVPVSMLGRAAQGAIGIVPTIPKPCSMGIGTKGGKSRGVGSGSRMLKTECIECGYTARVSAKWLAVGAPHCPEHGQMIAT